MLKRLFVGEEGQTLIEYGLLVALIAIVCIAILTVLGRKTKDVFITIEQSMVTTV
ncbi:MAG TPA: Flp family type IVb pilin [Armatimonadetes bacterium]|nr:Flp family type IVb pilin [Armatimonadota bacterium]